MSCELLKNRRKLIKTCGLHELFHLISLFFGLSARREDCSYSFQKVLVYQKN